MRYISPLLIVVISSSYAFASSIHMKEITYRGGLVKFAVPKHWIEEYEPDGGGMFYESGPNTGTLRLNVITAQSPKAIGSDAAYQTLQLLKGVNPKSIKRLPNGNAVTTWTQHSSEAGHAITLFWWHVTNPVPPHHIRTANFSYTVLTAQENTPQTLKEVQLLNSSIENAIFHPSLGQ